MYITDQNAADPVQIHGGHNFLAQSHATSTDMN